MGKWATYRHRGTAAYAVANIQAPPAPTLSRPAGVITVGSLAARDQGGSLIIETSEDNLAPWELKQTKPWAASQTFGPESAYSGLYYRAREIGGAVDFIGSSAGSPSLLSP